MGDRTTRAWISAAALGAVAAFAITTLSWLLQGVCDNAGDAALQTVRCDSERGHNWVVLETVLVVGGGLALLAGIVWALTRLSWVPLAAGAALTAAAFAGVAVISAIHLEARPLPRMTAVRFLDRRCRAPCAAGVRVKFTNDRRAPVFFELGPASNSSIEFRPYRRLEYDYLSGVLTRPGATPRDAVVFDAGSHVVRVGGVVEVGHRGRADVRREPLPPGVYSLDVHADVLDGGTQLVQRGTSVASGIRILPG